MNELMFKIPMGPWDQLTENENEKAWIEFIRIVSNGHTRGSPLLVSAHCASCSTRDEASSPRATAVPRGASTVWLNFDVRFNRSKELDVWGLGRRVQVYRSSVVRFSCPEKCSRRKIHAILSC